MNEPAKASTWREKYSAEIEAGKQDQLDRIAHIDEERQAYEERLKNFRLQRSMRNGFKLQYPSHVERALPSEDEPEW